MCGEMRGKRGDLCGHFLASKNVPHFENLFFDVARFSTLGFSPFKIAPPQPDKLSLGTHVQAEVLSHDPDLLCQRAPSHWARLYDDCCRCYRAASPPARRR